MVWPCITCTWPYPALSVLNVQGKLNPQPAPHLQHYLSNRALLALNMEWSQHVSPMHLMLLDAGRCLTHRTRVRIATTHLGFEQIPPTDRLLGRLATCLKTKARLHHIQIIEDVEVLCYGRAQSTKKAARDTSCIGFLRLSCAFGKLMSVTWQWEKAE